MTESEPTGAGGPTTEADETVNTLDYSTWIGDQPENVRTMLSGWEHGLKTALQNERDARAQLQKQLREMTGRAEGELQTQLTQLTNQIGEVDQRAAFYETAHAAGVSNLRLAYLVAVQDDLFDKSGRVNYDRMRTEYPELFAGSRKTPAGNAGVGASNQPPARSMNDFIRKAAGRD